MNKVKGYTGVFIGVTVAAIILYDVYAFFAGGSEATISQAMIDWSYQYPIFPFIMGVVMGHLFWQMKHSRD